MSEYRANIRSVKLRVDVLTYFDQFGWDVSGAWSQILFREDCEHEFRVGFVDEAAERS